MVTFGTELGFHYLELDQSILLNPSMQTLKIGLRFRTPILPS